MKYNKEKKRINKRNNEKYPEGGGTNDSLYHQCTFNNYGGMWIASVNQLGYLCRTINGELVPAVNSSDARNLTGKFSAISSTYNLIGIRPVVCLKQNVTVISGEGTIESPYEIRN